MSETEGINFVSWKAMREDRDYFRAAYERKLADEAKALDAALRLESELREARAASETWRAAELRWQEWAAALLGKRELGDDPARSALESALAAATLARVEAERERDETNGALSETLDMLADAHAKMLIPICVHCGEKPGEDAKGTHWRECQKHPAHLEVARLMDINRNLRACGVRSELEVSRLADELERLRRTVAFMEEQYLKTHGGSWGVCRFQARVAEAEAARQRMREALEGWLGAYTASVAVGAPDAYQREAATARAALGAEPDPATPEGEAHEYEHREGMVSWCWRCGEPRLHPTHITKGEP